MTAVDVTKLVISNILSFKQFAVWTSEHLLRKVNKKLGWTQLNEKQIETHDSWFHWMIKAVFESLYVMWLVSMAYAKANTVTLIVKYNKNTKVYTFFFSHHFTFLLLFPLRFIPLPLVGVQSKVIDLKFNSLVHFPSF